MKTTFLSLFTIIFVTSLAGQKKISGRIIDENNNPVVYANVCPKYMKIYEYMTSSDGTFRLEIPDTVTCLHFYLSKFNLANEPEIVELDYDDELSLDIPVENKTVFNLRLIKLNNTFSVIPVSEKYKELSDDYYNYFLYYNKDTLNHVDVFKKEDKKNPEYVWDIKYYKDYIKINNYITQIDADKKKYAKFSLSTIYFYFDKNGAIRKKHVIVDYGNHFENFYAKYFYKENKLNNGESFSVDYRMNPYDLQKWEIKEKMDMYMFITQNEILRKKLYQNLKYKYYSTDFKLVEM